MSDPTAVWLEGVLLQRTWWNKDLVFSIMTCEVGLEHSILFFYSRRDGRCWDWFDSWGHSWGSSHHHHSHCCGCYCNEEKEISVSISQNIIDSCQDFAQAMAHVSPYLGVVIVSFVLGPLILWYLSFKYMFALTLFILHTKTRFLWQNSFQWFMLHVTLTSRWPWSSIWPWHIV